MHQLETHRCCWGTKRMPPTLAMTLRDRVLSDPGAKRHANEMATKEWSRMNKQERMAGAHDLASSFTTARFMSSLRCTISRKAPPRTNNGYRARPLPCSGRVASDGAFRCPGG